MNEKRSSSSSNSSRGVELYLEEEIKVAASAIPNPVGLHGFDPVPLWEVGQGVQQGLREVGGGGGGRIE